MLGLSARLSKDGRVHSFSGTAIYLGYISMLAAITSLFLAPELLSDIDVDAGHGKSVDIWALGVLLHLLFTQEVECNLIALTFTAPFLG